MPEDRHEVLDDEGVVDQGREEDEEKKKVDRRFLKLESTKIKIGYAKSFLVQADPFRIVSQIVVILVTGPNVGSSTEGSTMASLPIAGLPMPYLLMVGLPMASIFMSNLHMAGLPIAGPLRIVSQIVVILVIGSNV